MFVNHRRGRLAAAALGALVVGAIQLPSPAAASPPALFEDTFSPQQPGWSFDSPSAGFLGELNDTVNVAGVTLTVTASSAGSATFDFDLLSFRSLDDATSCCTDTLTFTVNGQDAFSAAVGDRGTDSFLTNPAGATMGPASLIAGGQTRRISVPTILAAGSNTFTWSYSPLQTVEDEAWGLDNVILASPSSPEYEVNITTFIPGNSIAAPLFWAYRCPNQGRLFFRGDTRSFDPTADSYRTRQLVTIVPDQSKDSDGIKDGTPVNATGLTRSYAGDALPILDDADDDGVLGDCHLLHGQGHAGTANMAIEPTWLGSKTLQVDFRMSAGNPLVTVPEVLKNIDYTLRLTIDASTTPATWQLTGTEDGFPAMEIYINGSAIYQRSSPPPYSLTTALALLPIIGDVPVNLGPNPIP